MNVRASLLGAACLAAVGLAGCASTPPEEDPVQIKLNDLDTRLARIERVAANQSLLDLANQLDALRNDVRAMHNDVDQLNHNLELSRKQQHDLYADLDQRMKALEGRGGAGGSGSSTAEVLNALMRRNQQIPKKTASRSPARHRLLLGKCLFHTPP